MGYSQNAGVLVVLVGPGNGLSPFRCQAITLNNVDVLSIGHLGANFSDLCPEILTFYQFENVCEMAAILFREI